MVSLAKGPELYFCLIIHFSRLGRQASNIASPLSTSGGDLPCGPSDRSADCDIFQLLHVLYVPYVVHNFVSLPFRV